ncbi:16S rRNA (adenine(1518)-N(6)/adenine(1519)-N(6))-dimethyltransferase RsmA [Cardiobacterium hominis]
MPPPPVGEGWGGGSEHLALGAVDNSTDEPLSLWERGWGEGEKIARGGGSKHPASATRPAPQKLRLVGNLPYNLSSPILFHCLAQREHIHDMHYMLQKEVVDRITAAPGSKTYGRLSLMAQLWCETTALFDIPPDAFDPPPKVDSAVVRLVPRPAPAWQIDDLATFDETVRLAFAQRRKMLRKTFAHWMSAAALEALDIDPTARAETLDGAAFARLANARYQQERQP